MSIYVEVNNKRYPAYITGRLSDKDWDDRESKAIKCEMTYEEAMLTFVEDVAWSIVEEYEDFEEHVVIEKVENDDGETVEVEKIVRNPVTRTNVIDNSEYSIPGDVVDHRDGNITVKMGKPTAKELLALLEGVL